VRRRGGLRAGPPALFALGLVAAAGCGHRVTPTAAFRTAESLPLPTDLAAHPSGAAVNVTWLSDPEDFAFIDGFHVYRAEGEAAPAGAAWVRLTREPFTESLFVDGDVADGARYWYRLTSVSPAGVESVPTGAVWIRVDLTPPAPPGGLAARAVFSEVAGRYEVVVEWDGSGDPGFDHYNLYREPSYALQDFIPGLLDPEYDDFSVAAGSTYVYRVTAVDAAGNESDPSAPVTVTVPEVP